MIVHGLDERPRGVCASVVIHLRSRVFRSDPGMYHCCYHTSCKQRKEENAVSRSEHSDGRLSTIY